MMTTRFLSQTFAVLPNSRLNTPIVPGPQTSCVISTSAFTQTLSPACTLDLPAARARIFSVSVMELKVQLSGGFAIPLSGRNVVKRNDVQRVNLLKSVIERGDEHHAAAQRHEVRMRDMNSA